MISLYNIYQARNNNVPDLTDFDKQILEFCEFCKENEVSYIEMEHILHENISVIFAQEKLRRAMEMRRDERK